MSNLEEIFKVGGMPTATFVEPNEFPALVVALRTPGRGIVIEGPSGIGKTTSLHRALDQLDLNARVLFLSGRKGKDIELISQLSEMENIGIVVIDDFHKLNSNIKAMIADYMKILADEEDQNSKIVVLGINQAGQSLINFAHDLNNRLEVIKFETNPKHKVLELLTKGELSLNIGLNIKNEIADAAHGSFYIAQMLAHQACLDSKILESQNFTLETKVSFELVKGKVFDRLSRTFHSRTVKFAQGTRVRSEGRAPYLHLLYWLGSSEEWSLSIDSVLARYPELKGSVVQIVDNGYLEKIIDGSTEIQAVLHFDPVSKLLSVEDPQYIYYLRNISWSAFVKEVGFLTMSFPCPYDFALSFSGDQRAVAELLFNELQAMEFEIFYDHNEQHRILAEDVEDYLRPIYMTDAQFVIALLSENYPKRIWTRFESQQFKDRFKDNAVIPIWFDTVPEGVFDESNTVGGYVLNTENELGSEVKKIAELCRKKIAEIRK